MDITETLAPNSDQLDAIELQNGPRTFQVKSVDVKQGDQPVSVHFTDFPRPWRPGKNMRRVLAACWGAESSQWTGRRVTLFYDPNVTFGKEKPGGTRISHLSNIDGPQRVSILETRGKSGVYEVKPLADAPTGPTPADVAAAPDVDALRAMYRAASPEVRGLITARVAELTPPEPEQQPEPDVDPWQQPETDQFIDAFPNGDDQ